MWRGGKKFIFIRIKKDEGQRKEKCHAKSMMSNEDNERIKRDTQYVPLFCLLRIDKARAK
jgi:hypothetical protein